MSEPSDGEIYRNLRQCRGEGNLHLERRWFARLSNHGQRCIDDLLNQADITKAFDDLLPIPGLWDGMRISSLNEVISMRCNEVGNIFDVVDLANLEAGSYTLPRAH